MAHGPAGHLLLPVLVTTTAAGDATATPATIDVVITPQVPVPDYYHLDITVRFQ